MCPWRTVRSGESGLKDGKDEGVIDSSSTCAILDVLGPATAINLGIASSSVDISSRCLLRIVLIGHMGAFLDLHRSRQITRQTTLLRDSVSSAEHLPRQ